jgi:hypothetical protein
MEPDAPNDCSGHSGLRVLTYGSRERHVAAKARGGKEIP